MSVVVYNRFNLDSILAAALIKSLGNKDTIIMDNTNIVPRSHDTYIWLDMELEKSPKWTKNEFHDKENIAIKQIDTDEEGFKSILFQCVDFVTKEEIVNPETLEIIMKLNGAIRKFYTNSLSLQEIVFVFNNLKAAEKILQNANFVSTGIDIYTDTPLKKENVKQFYDYLATVKSKINNNYSHQYIKFRLRLLETFVTSVQDDWIWIKRLLTLSDQKYANINMCPIGCVVDTNLPDLDKFKLDLNVKLGHVY